MRPPFKTLTELDLKSMSVGGERLAEKTWVYWVGLIIVALSIIGLIHGFAVMALPVVLVHHMARGVRWGSVLVGMGVLRLVASVVFLGVGMYMMKNGTIVKQ
jgi:hypothetical protein